MFTIYQIAFVTDRRTDRDLDKIKLYDCQANYIVARAQPRPWERGWPECKLITLVRTTAQ